MNDGQQVFMADHVLARYGLDAIKSCPVLAVGCGRVDRWQQVATRLQHKCCSSNGRVDADCAAGFVFVSFEIVNQLIDLVY